MSSLICRIVSILATVSFVVAPSPAADLVDEVNWPEFLSRHDMVWDRLPDQWGAGAFTGNGLLGANVYTLEDGKTLRWHIGRTDVTYRTSRLPVGDLVLKTAGVLQGCQMRLDLWNAELKGTIVTSEGKIGIRSFTHADRIVQVIELKPDEGEASCHFEWQPGLALDPRKIYRKEPIPDDQRNPAPQASEEDGMHLCVQPLSTGGAHATAWTDVAVGDGHRIFLSVGFSPRQNDEAVQQATKAVKQAAASDFNALVSAHRAWWHAYWPESFVSIPDTRLESFYWIQMYKLASATRSDRPAIDLMGPWFRTTPWAKIWWNLNIQLTYWPVLASNRLELGESLCKMLDNGADNLAANAKPFSDDSAFISRATSYDCRGGGGSELCNLPWVMHNYYLQYRYCMDDAVLRDHIFPLLKRSINYYFHFMEEGSDGYLHITRGLSPEYPGQPSPNPDCNIDLALLRWGCQTLLAICDRLDISDPLEAQWKDTLARLVPYPIDENGLMISASVPFAQSHRHYSHLLMIYPLYIMNPEQPENRELVMKSLNHWMGLPKALQGYSYTGAASISALMGRGDDAAMYLNRLLDKRILPNTMYLEAGPVIETPLSAAASLHDMLLSSWGAKIRVFPAVPDAWRDIAFRDMRTEGAFLVSAARKDGKTAFIHVKSLAGEPCHLITDMPDPKGQGVEIRKAAAGEYVLSLKKGQSVLLTPGGAQADLTVAPVAAQRDRCNTYGLR